MARRIFLFLIVSVLLLLLASSIQADPALPGEGLRTQKADAPAAGVDRYAYEWLCPQDGDCGTATVFHDLVDTFPAGLTISYVSATPARGDCELTTTVRVTCTFPNFRGGQVINVVFRVNVPDGIQLYQHTASNVSFEISRRIEIIDPTGIGTSLVTDGGLESQPLDGAWVIKRPNFARQACNKDGKPPVSRTGACAFRIGGSSKVASVAQNLEPLGDRDDSVWFSVWINSKNLAIKGRAQLALTRATGSLSTYRVDLPVRKNSNGWVQLSGQQYYYGPLSKLRVVLSYNRRAGRVFFDDVQVVLVEPEIFD